MAAALYALKIFTRDISNCHIQLKVDNTSSLAWINKKTVPSEAKFLTVKEFWDYCMGKNLGLSTSYINTNKNAEADKEYKKFHFHFSRNIFMLVYSFSCIPQIINKIEAESATGILVVPLFTTQHWFSRLLRIPTSEPLLLPKSHTCLYFTYRLRNSQNIPNF